MKCRKKPLAVEVLKLGHTNVRTLQRPKIAGLATENGHDHMTV